MKSYSDSSTIVAPFSKVTKIHSPCVTPPFIIPVGDAANMLSTLMNQGSPPRISNSSASAFSGFKNCSDTHPNSFTFPLRLWPPSKLRERHSKECGFNNNDICVTIVVHRSFSSVMMSPPLSWMCRSWTLVHMTQAPSSSKPLLDRISPPT